MKSFLELLDPQGFTSQFGLVLKPDPTSIPDLPKYRGVMTTVYGDPATDPHTQWAKENHPETQCRPDYADVIDMENNAIEEINDSVLDAENVGVLSRMAYPLPLSTD